MSVRRRPDVRADAGAQAIEEAFARAEFTTLQTLFEAVPARTIAESARIDLVRARFARITGDVSTCIEATTRAMAQHPDPTQRLFARTLRAVMLKRNNRQRGEAESEVTEVVRAVAAADPTAVGRCVYLLAFDAWQDRAYDLAEDRLARNFVARSNLPETHSLSGWIDVKRERYGAAAVHFEAALEAMHAAGEVDERLRALLVHGVTNIAAETVDFALGARAIAAYENTAWTGGLTVEHVNTLIMLRYLALLEGDLDRAWLLARRGATLIADGPYAIHGETSAAFVSELLGERRGASIQLQRAWQLLRAHRWSDADQERRVALTDFAMVAARSMAAEARQAITIYQSLEAAENTRNSLNVDRRIDAFELMAAGRVSEALGERQAARLHYERALTIWRELACGMRIGEAAADLYRLTGEAAYAKIVRTILRTAPRAWFGTVLRTHGSPLERLTVVQRRVLDELLQGKTAKSIGLKLGRSHHTVSNHTRTIFAVFNVNSRGRLLARCAELGIAPLVLQERAKPQPSTAPARKTRVRRR